MDWHSVVDIATCYELDGSNPNGVDFFATVQSGPGAHTAFYSTGTGFFPGVKQPSRGVDPHPRIVQRLKKEWNYNSSPPLGRCGRL
jgi:hypothetical protein